MQEKTDMSMKPAPPEQAEPTEPPVLRIRIGGTTYKVAIYFSKTSNETMGDKIARLIKNEAANAPTSPAAAPKSKPEESVPQTSLTARKEKQ
jgi:phage tail sheath gpL-like